MTKKNRTIGVGDSMPKGEARPLGTKAPRASKKTAKVLQMGTRAEQQQAVAEAAEKNLSRSQENAGQVSESLVESSQAAITQQEQTEAPQAQGEKVMTLQFKGLNRKGNAAIYTGIRGSVRFPLAAFADRQAPATVELQGPFVEPAQPKAKMSAEERKAARANAPKPTLAEKIAKREAALEKLRQKAAAEQAQGQEASL